MRTLVMTSCTGQKKYSPENQLTINDFRDTSLLHKRSLELSAYEETAGEMYTGRQHTSLMHGIKEYRKHRDDIDVAILSAGYGLLKEDDKIVPYNVTFNSMNGTAIKEWSQHQRMNDQLQNFVSKYDLVFFLLGDSYLKAIDWERIRMKEHQKFIFFVGNASQNKVLVQENMYTLAMGSKEASYFKAGLVWLKGELFSRLLKSLIKSPEYTWGDILKNPMCIRDFIINGEQVEQLSFFEESKVENDLLPINKYVPPFFVSQDLIAKNYTGQFRFFMPENDDRVDGDYDFIRDYSDPNRNPLLNDVYAHDLYGSPQYDGVLISKVNIDATKRKRELIKEMGGLHNFLRLPLSIPIMGDCGAFSYFSQEEPPYNTAEILEYYDQYRFDIGVSIDHLIVGSIEKDESERARRYEITLKNAREFIEMHKERGYKFTPMGVVQGWDPFSFRSAVEEVISMGYKHIALGGLAKDKSEKIFEILKEISPIIPDDSYRVHLFGVARSPEIMDVFSKLGVTSFDSASPLRRAWLGTGHNYHAVSGKHYAAIRIPEAKGIRIQKRMEQIGMSLEDLQAMEQKALDALRAYDQGSLDLETTLNVIMEYDKLVGEGRDRHWDLYKEVLEDKPWKECDCSICKEVGVEVIIFRGNNRNRRRGFHNTFAYYEQLKRYQKMKTN
ncbi:tRNA-guanine family transglycosylase [Laceyella tengchongensis]|uniref:tRNA-guanine family transglycosylase n=1 Tax=Laceyella tengchongensis TaxID=574699 RepID=A0AA45WSB7_9BACL|nr:tRNA-guanine transglycosylase DpdA [Laceyella tengchongensis]SMP32053.1 tRNA-guanine family transglycosylase [Laceyella tengchongensis]